MVEVMIIKISGMCVGAFGGFDVSYVAQKTVIKTWKRTIPSSATAMVAEAEWRFWCFGSEGADKAALNVKWATFLWILNAVRVQTAQNAKTAHSQEFFRCVLDRQTDGRTEIPRFYERIVIVILFWELLAAKINCALYLQRSIVYVCILSKKKKEKHHSALSCKREVACTVYTSNVAFFIHCANNLLTCLGHICQWRNQTIFQVSQIWIWQCLLQGKPACLTFADWHRKNNKWIIKNKGWRDY